MSAKQWLWSACANAQADQIHCFALIKLTKKAFFRRTLGAFAILSEMCLGWNSRDFMFLATSLNNVCLICIHTVSSEFCGVWSKSTLFASVRLSPNVGLIIALVLKKRELVLEDYHTLDKCNGQWVFSKTRDRHCLLELHTDLEYPKMVIEEYRSWHDLTWLRGYAD